MNELAVVAVGVALLVSTVVSSPWIAVSVLAFAGSYGVKRSRGRRP